MAIVADTGSAAAAPWFAEGDHRVGNHGDGEALDREAPPQA